MRITASENTLEVFVKVSFFFNLSSTYVVIDAVDVAGESVCLANRVHASCSLCKSVHR